MLTFKSPDPHCVSVWRKACRGHEGNESSSPAQTCSRVSRASILKSLCQQHIWNDSTRHRRLSGGLWRDLASHFPPEEGWMSLKEENFFIVSHNLCIRLTSYSRAICSKLVGTRCVSLQVIFCRVHYGHIWRLQRLAVSLSLRSRCTVAHWWRRCCSLTEFSLFACSSTCRTGLSK